MIRPAPILLALLFGSLMPAAARAGDEEDLRAAFGEAYKLHVAGKLAEAGPLYEKALALTPKVYPTDHRTTAVILTYLGNLRLEEVKRDVAEKHLLRALAMSEKVSGKENPDLPLILDGLAQINKDQGKIAEAEALYLRCLAVGEKCFGKEHISVAHTLYSLGLFSTGRRKFSEAEACFMRCLTIREKRLGKEHLEVASVLNNLANVWFEQGKFADARRFHERALAIREKAFGKDHPETVRSLNNLANVHLELGEFARAEELQLRALAAVEKAYGKDHPKMADPLYNLGATYSNQGKYAQAEQFHRRNLELHERMLGKDHPALAPILSNLSNVLVEQGKIAAAESLSLRAVSLCEKSKDQQSNNAALTLTTLAKIYTAQDRRNQAEALLVRAAGMLEQFHGRDHREVADCLIYLAHLQSQGPKWRETLPLYQRCQAIYEKAYGPNHYRVAMALQNEAGLFVRAEKFRAAESLYLHSLKIFENVNGKVHPAVATCLNNLAQVSDSQGNFAESARWQMRLWPTMRQYLLRELPDLTPAQQIDFLEMQERVWFASALGLAQRRRDDPNIVEASAAWLVNVKSIALEAQTIRSRLEREATGNEAQAVLRELQSIRARQAALALNSRQRETTAALREELEMQRRELEKKLALSSRTASKMANPWMDLGEVRKNIPADAVFIDIVRFSAHKLLGNEPPKPQYAAWIIPPSGPIRIVDLGDAAAIDAAVQAARQVLEETAERLEQRETEKKLESDAAGKLAAVAKLVFEPLKPHLGKASKLILSPDGDLWLLPWAALPVGTGRYLIEDYSLRFVVAGRDLVETSAGTKPDTTAALILADPNFNLTPAEVAGAVSIDRTVADNTRSASMETRGVGRVKRLPGTAAEARQAFERLNKLTAQTPKLCLDAEASETIVKATKSPQVLVLATHGFFLKKQEVELKSDTGLELAGNMPANLVKDKEGKEVENPLLRCGLLLAGANKRSEAKEGQDDGVLTGLEIVGLDLRGTQMVVLSACETGLGDVQTGEGVAGLRQAFQLAGARSVLATLWQISDSATSRLMNSFYDELAGGVDRAEALTRAQRQFLKQRRETLGAAHPYYWASFTLTGK